MQTKFDTDSKIPNATLYRANIDRSVRSRLCQATEWRRTFACAALVEIGTRMAEHP